MRFSEQVRSRAPVINVTSLIDVMFLLVIFVLVTAKYEPEGGIAVDLPKGASEDVPQTPEIFRVTIMHEGTIFLDKDEILLGELPAAIKKKRQALRDPVLVIRSDQEAPAGLLVSVTEIAKQCGQQKLNFKTKR